MRSLVEILSVGVMDRHGRARCGAGDDLMAKATMRIARWCHVGGTVTVDELTKRLTGFIVLATGVPGKTGR